MPKIGERQKHVKGDSVMAYAGCQWKVSVVLSTNYVSKVLRPEVNLEIFTKEGAKIHMTITTEKFEELRR